MRSNECNEGVSPGQVEIGESFRVSAADTPPPRRRVVSPNTTGIPNTERQRVVSPMRINESDISVPVYPSATADIPSEPVDPLQAVLAEAEASGLTEKDLRSLAQTLSIHDRPSMRGIVTRRYTEATGLSRDEVLKHARNYAKERIKATEQGPLHHYHQTGTEFLGKIAEKGSLLSYKILKEHREAPSSGGTGSRSDVVQMTRDSYDGDGNVKTRGLHGDRSLGAMGVGITLVFTSSVMDHPGYDSTGTYPNAPEVPLENLAAVLVKTEADIPNVSDTLQSHQIPAPVVTRAEWEQATYGAEDK